MPMKYPPHPGRSILRDCMEPLGMDVVETAQKLGVGPEELSSVIRGESAITFALAIRLDRLFGCGASTWYQLQAAYDRAQGSNKGTFSGEPEPLEIRQQTATVPLEHGRVVYTTYDADVIALGVVSSDGPESSPNLGHDQVGFRFVGEGPGAVQIQMIYQPSAGDIPRLIVGVLFKTCLEWDAEYDEYVGHIDAGEWNSEMRKLEAGKDAMNALYAGLRSKSSSPVFVGGDSVETVSELQAKVLKEAETLLNKPTRVVRAEDLALV